MSAGSSVWGSSELSSVGGASARQGKDPGSIPGHFLPCFN